jgi:zinc protease
MSVDLPRVGSTAVPVAGLRPSRTLLDNGVVVIARETRKTPAVTINLAMRAGSICDPASGLGAMHLLSRLLDRATATRSGAEIADALDNRGVSLRLSVTRHLFSLVCTCLADDFPDVLALIGDMVMTPGIPAADVELRTGEVITALRQDQDNPAVRAVESLMTQLYGADHPYGRPAKGTIDSVEALTRERLLALHDAYFAPSLLSVVVVGDIPARRAVDTVASVLGTWQKPVPRLPTLTSPSVASGRRRIVHSMMNKAQADIAYGFTTISRADPDYYTFWLMNNVLGQYALGGRLGDNIRERQGMAYYVSSTFDPNVLEGPLVIRAGVSAANVDRAVDDIDDEIRRLIAEGVSEKELTESRHYMVGSLPRALETNAGIAQFLQTAEFFALGLDYDVQLPEYLAKVTVEGVRDVARRYLDPDRAAVTIAGPYPEP